MNSSVIYSKTGKGTRAVTAKSKALSAQALRLLSLIDGKSGIADLMTAIELSSEPQLQQILTQLEKEGYIRVVDELAMSSDFDIRSPIEVAEISAEEFLRIQIAAEGKDDKAQAREQQEAEARAQAYAEEQLKKEALVREQQESERKLLMVTDILAKSGDRIDIEKLATDEIVPTQAERKAQAEAEYRAKKEKARREAKAKAKQEAQQKMRMETGSAPLEQASIGAFADSPAKVEAEDATLTQAKHDLDQQAVAETQRITGEAEEITRLELFAEAEVKAKRAQEEQQEAKRIAREQAEAKARQEAEQALQRAAEEAARVEALARAEEAAKARREEEDRAREEAKRIAREQAEAKARQEAEERDRIIAERHARLMAEERARAEAKAKREEAEQKRIEEKRIARELAQAQAARLAEAKALAAVERAGRRQAEAEIKARAKILAKQQANDRALARAEEKAQARAMREPVDLSKELSTIFNATRYLLIAAVVALVVLSFSLPLLNLNMLIEPIQKLATESIREPVNIQEIHASLWPQPHLMLNDVSIGKLADVKVEKMDVMPALSTLMTDPRTLKSIKLEALTLDQSALNRPLKWINAVGKSGKLKLDQISLTKLSIKIKNGSVPEFDGKITLDSAGRLAVAHFNSVDHSLEMEVSPKADSYSISIDANEWQPPFMPSIVIGQLHAEGLTSDSQVQFSTIEGSLYGGSIKASMLLDWSNGWSANGDLELTKINLEELSTALSSIQSLKGRLNSQGHFSMRSDEAVELAKAPLIDANFDIHSGEIKGIDMVRAMQAPTRDTPSGGWTRFDSLSGKLNLKDSHYQYSQLRLNYGQFLAGGEFDIGAEQTLSGKINMELALKSRKMQSHFNLSGKINSPKLN
jgi:hypothetical protein